jgi:adenine phosphoribosyltransferase|tara:strand:+ start:157 stop:648 length:492 start_codon:yes stop_codon:yes gene_type:complete
MYKEFIKEVPNFPIDGIDFKDISPLLADQETFRSALVDMGRQVRLPDYWIGIDSRGYLFSSALATYFGGGVVCARKQGKTPGEFVSETYDLEYGTATLELQPGNGQVVIVDDVLATGGTLQATNNLAEKAGYEVVGNLVLVDLKYVPRIDNFNLNVRSVVKYA